MRTTKELRDFLEGILQNPLGTVLAVLASDPDISPERLAELSQIRELALTENPGVPISDLILVAEAANPNTLPERLAELAKVGDEWVRYAVARNPQVPDKLFLEIAFS